MNCLEKIRTLSIEEKCALLSGAETFKTRGMPKHDIPQIWLSDGPHGLRKQAGESDHLGLNPSVPATCFPTASAIANSWDTALGEEIGAALGEEAAAQEVSVLLGPGLNMKRNPLCGRSFEYFSEDPYLAGKLAAGYIRGIQSKGVAACPKHFAANSQETRRMASDSIVDERTLREIYLTGFEIAVKEGHPRSIMSSYNLVNGTYANENKHLLMDILRDEWGFDGAVITDWGGSNDHALGVKNGSTLEMPAPGGDSVRELLAAVKSGKITEADIDARLLELLPLVFDTKAALDTAPREFDVAAHHALARRAAEESLVLLKNDDNLLPLAADTKVAVIGDFAVNPRYQGAGSSMVNSTQIDVLSDMLIDSEINVIGYQQGFDRHGKPNQTLQKAACELAGQADTVILCMGLDEIAESEGLDRSGMKLAQNQIDLLQAVAAVNPKVAVVLYSGSAIETPWLDNCKALLYAALSGQAGAGAVADALTGKVNPCGKLAETWPLTYADVPSAADFATRRKTVEYREGLYIGYRYFTTVEKDVRFPFGYGMSYTTFDYADMVANEQGVSFTVTNTGNVAGTEIAQLYISKKNGQIFRPAKELKGFARVTLAPGEKQRIAIMLDDKAFRFWNVKSNRWEIEGGEYELLVGASVEDIRLKETITVHGTATVNPYENLDLDCYYRADVLNVSDTIIDGIFVSAYVGTNALAAINIVYPIVNVLTGIALVFATGGSAVAALHIGGNRKEEANRAFSVSSVAAVLLGCLVSLIVLTNLSKILALLGATDVTIAGCKTYAFWWLWATPVVIGKELFTYFIRVDGSPTYSFVTALSGGVLNIILDFVLVGRMQMGIYGAALATILGLVLSFFMGIYYFVRMHKALSFTLHGLSAKVALHCMVNGASEFVDQLAIAITTIVFNRTALAFAGEDGVAAVSIIMYLQFLFIGVYFGFSMGMAPPLSYAYGDGRIDVCRKLERYAHRFFAIAPLAIYALTYFLAPAGVSCFADASSPVFSIAVSGMRIYGLSFLFSGVNIFAAVRMMAYGKGHFSGLITFLRSFALLLLFLTVLPQKFGLTGVWLAVPTAEVLTLLVSVWFLRPIQR